MSTSLLKLLQNQIDITRVPFSDRGSRLLVYRHRGRNSLYIRLAERLIRLEPGLEEYLRRPPFIDDLQWIDERGHALDFCVTTSPESLLFETSVGNFYLAFHDERTLAVGLPPNHVSGVRLRVRQTYCRTTRSGGELKFVHNLIYRTNDEVIANRVVPQEDGSIVEFMVQAGGDCTVSMEISDNHVSSRPVIGFSEVRRNAGKRWKNWFDRVPLVNKSLLQKYAYAWWVIANNFVSPLGNVGYEAMMPTKAFYVGIWLWDSAFHALAVRHADIQLARNQLRVMLAHQLADGMLPDAIFDEGIVSEIDHPIHARVTKPPLLAWAAVKIHETEPNIAFLREVYDPLTRCTDWWFKHNDDDADGIVQYNHPYSSGLDDSPLWDHGMPVESPDLNTYLHIDMSSLAVIAEILGKLGEASRWRRKAKTLTRRMIKHLWDEEAGIFRALYNKKPIRGLTPFNLYPLWTGQLPDKITKRLLAHLQNPAEFWGDHILPTVARNDPAYHLEKMWRGPVWANINYIFVEALQKTGEHKLAAELRDKTLDLIASQPGIYEYYNSMTGNAPDSAAPTFGWTAAVFIELALQASAEKGQQTHT